MSESSHQLSLPPGYSLGRYRLLEVLGSGSFGITYLARDVEEGRLVAIEELLPIFMVTRQGAQVFANFRDDQLQWEWAQQRFREEAEAPLRCNHPNLLKVYCTFPANGTVYMVTRYEEGQVMEKWLWKLEKEEQRLPTEEELVRILGSVLGALEHIHAQGFLHRDIKPENIYLTNDQRVVLLGFGSARQVIFTKTMPEARMIVTGYAPPEQYASDVPPGPWTDLYAVGGAIYRAITGEVPPEAVSRIISGRPDPCKCLAKAYAGKFSAPLLQSVDRALEIDYRKRFQSAEEWKSRLLVAQEPEPNEGRPAGETRTAGRKLRGLLARPEFFAGAALMGMIISLSIIGAMLLRSTAGLDIRRLSGEPPGKEIGPIPTLTTQEPLEVRGQIPSSRPNQERSQEDGDSKKAPRKKTPAPTQEVAANTNPTAPAPKDEIAPPTPGIHTGPSTESSTHGETPAPKVDGDKAKIESGANSHFEHLAPDTPDSPMALAKASTPAVAAVATPRAVVSFAQTLSAADLDHIGKRVWKNECDGTIQGLTSWNGGENFASLGIGHFIWYPEGVRGPYEESFPPLVKFLERNAIHLPEWLAQAKVCPWKNRMDFMAAKGTQQMIELRDLLATTLHLQSEFLAERLAKTVRTLGGELEAPKRQHVQVQYALLAQSGAGTFALIDYVNFKGEGTNPNERYKGQGWGLLQVLETMDARSAEEAPHEFGEAAVRVLARRVANAPKNEDQWLQGWTNRVRSY